MSIFKDVFPPVDTALALEPEELALPLVECLCRYEQRPNDSGMLNLHNFSVPTDYSDRDSRKEMEKAIAEAWVWLQSEGLIAPRPGASTGGWIFVTRRGKKFRESGDVNKFKAANLLPHKILDPQLASKIRAPYLRGDYESAVFESFKEVEIRIRQISGYGHNDIGVKLMRKAFKPEDGILTDKEQLPSEQQGICELFAGAIGSFKNPSSHRDVSFTDPAEVAELIMLADLLIRIAERRKPQ
jgi:uncharacterized protein (TIGR02391 family)